MEFPGFNPLNALASAAELPAYRMAHVGKVTPGRDAQGATSDNRQHAEPGRPAAEARDSAALRHEMQRRGLPAGPPPTFQMNLLEAEAGINQAIARVEAARTQSRDTAAIQPAPQPETALPPSLASRGSPAPNRAPEQDS
jgi:hypothetical protein